MTRLNSLYGRIPSSADKRAAGIFVKSALLSRAPVLPSKTEAFKSSGRGRFRKMAFAAFGRRQSHRLWHAGPVDSLATIFHAWRWGRKHPGPADLVFPIYTSPQVRLVIFLLDVSDSMSETLDLTRLWLAKSMGEAYFRRDPVAIITVQGQIARSSNHQRSFCPASTHIHHCGRRHTPGPRVAEDRPHDPTMARSLSDHRSYRFKRWPFDRLPCRAASVGVIGHYQKICPLGCGN